MPGELEGIWNTKTTLAYIAKVQLIKAVIAFMLITPAEQG